MNLIKIILGLVLAGSSFATILNEPLLRNINNGKISVSMYARPYLAQTEESRSQVVGILGRIPNLYTVLDNTALNQGKLDLAFMLVQIERMSLYGNTIHLYLKNSNAVLHLEPNTVPFIRNRQDTTEEALDRSLSMIPGDREPLQIQLASFNPVLPDILKYLLDLADQGQIGLGEHAKADYMGAWGLG